MDWSFPMGLVTNNANTRLYVSDRHRICRLAFDINSDVTNEKYQAYELIGNRISGMRDGNKSTTRFFEPRFIAISPDDRFLYVSDFYNFRIRRVDISSDMKSKSGNKNQMSSREQKGHWVIAILLKNTNIDINLKENGGKTALHWACMRRPMDSAVILLEHGAKLEDSNGISAESYIDADEPSAISY